MLDQFSRTELLLGREGVERLARAHVAVFGLGGVGGYAAEALVRSGVGALDLIDSDRVSLTNLNRQILATHRTLGQYKADAARDRALEINPEARVTARRVFYGPDTAGDFDFSQYDYVIDAIDTVTGKLALIQQALAAGTPIISCMGAGNKLDPTAFRVADIYKTSASTASPTWSVRRLSRVWFSAWPILLMRAWRVSETVAPGVLAGGRLCPAAAVLSVFSAA